MRRHSGWWFFAAVMVVLLEAATAWGYYFDDRREMSLSGFAYTRGVISTQGGISSSRHTYAEGNLVQHRNFLTLEWRHNLNRLSRERNARSRVCSVVAASDLQPSTNICRIIFDLLLKLRDGRISILSPEQKPAIGTVNVRKVRILLYE